MYKLWVAVKKEYHLLIHDKAGLILMFALPLLLVYIITIIQDSAFRMVNENNISILVVNKDEGEEGKNMIKLMKESGFFDLREDASLEKRNIKKELEEKDILTSLWISSDFSEKIIQKANLVGSSMLTELGLESASNSEKKLSMPQLEFYHDPVLQENYCSSVMNITEAFLKTIEGDLMISELCAQLDLKEAPVQIRNILNDNQIAIKRFSTSSSESEKLPNSTQHNVPAWTIFAMFFMVVSLGNNIVKERLNGSFIRLKTMPSSFFLVLGSKMILYMLVAVIQVILIFSLTKITFPFIGLPELTMPGNTTGFILIVILSALAAVSYALLVGSMARTVEQSHVFGAMSIIIFAAIGGVWVPDFIMPDFMKNLALISPLNWCLEGFYVLFLKGGDWSALQPVVIGLSLFVFSCLVLSFLKLKNEKIV